MSGKAKKQKEIKINSLFISQINKSLLFELKWNCVYTLFIFTLFILWTIEVFDCPRIVKPYNWNAPKGWLLIVYFSAFMFPSDVFVWFVSICSRGKAHKKGLALQLLTVSIRFRILIDVNLSYSFSMVIKYITCQSKHCMVKQIHIF